MAPEDLQRPWMTIDPGLGVRLSLIKDHIRLGLINEYLGRSDVSYR